MTLVEEKPAEAAAGADDPARRPVVRLLPGQHKRARLGHPWVYSNEIEMTAAAKALPPGAIVTLETADGRRFASATFNPHPLISARILDRDPATPIDRAFLETRLRRALALREAFLDLPYFRLVHSEADGLPGLIVDRYGALAVVQCNTAGMDRLTETLIAALEAVLDPVDVVLRNDGAGRALEGLSATVRTARGRLEGPVTVVENGVRFLCDPAGGQKTGWFFDHRDNRAVIARLARGKRVLDLYCYLGGFGVAAAAAGAAEVVGVDRSAPALTLAEETARTNGVGERCRFVRTEAFAEMARLAASGERFDIVVADPPAFVKSKKDLRVGLKGYRKMVKLALPLVRPGGFLLAASCSHHVDAAAFSAEVRAALRDAGREARLLRAGGAGPDHPVHPFLPESAYLKSLLLQVD